MKNKFLVIAALLLTITATAAVVDKFDTITTNSPSKLKVDFLKGIRFTGTDSVKLPVGTTLQRDAAPVDGMFRLNSTTSNYEGYVSGAWNTLLKYTTSLSIPVETSLSGNKITNLADPTSAQDGATKNYIDTALAGVDFSNLVDRTTNQSVGGIKTFSSTIVGNISGNAATVTTIPNLTGQVTSVGNTTTLVNSAVTGQPLTGFVSAPGTVTASDTILTAINKLNANIAGATVNLTGPITSVGNATSIASQTGTGTKFVVDNSPTIITPIFSGTAIGNISGNAATVTTNANLTGEVVSTGNATTVTNAAVIAKTLTGFTSGAGTVSSADSILSATQKLDGNIGLQIPKSTLGSKGDLLGASAANTPTTIAVGTDGKVLTADSTNAKGLSYFKNNSVLDAAFQITGKEDLSTWIKGNNATVVPGTATGSFAGTLSKVTGSGAMNGESSYTFTQAAGSLNDYFCSPAQAIDPQFHGNTVYLTFPSLYNGLNGDIQVSLWDVTGTATFIPFTNLSDLNASLTNSTAVYSATIPSGVTSAKVCYQVKALNSAKVFALTNIQASKSIYQVVNLLNTTDFTPYTGTLTNLGSATQALSFKDLGDIIIVRGRITINAGLTSGNFGVGLPSGYSASVTGYVGKASGFGAGSYVSGSVYPGTSTSLSVTADGGAGIWSPTVPITWAGSNYFDLVNVIVPVANRTAVNSAFILPIQQVSSDTINFVHKTTSLVDSDPVGTYNTYSIAAGTNTATICATAPTQTSASMNANGINVTARGYGTASNCATPTYFYIKIPTGQRNLNYKYYNSTARTNPVDTSMWPINSSTLTGLEKYDTGIDGYLAFSAGINASAAFTTRYFGVNNSGNGVGGGFVTFNGSTTPSLAAVPKFKTVGAYYTGAPPTGTLTSSYNTVTFGTKFADSDNAYSGGVYTVPENGFYAIDSFIRVSGTFAANGGLRLGISIDNTNPTITGFGLPSSGATAGGYTAKVSILYLPLLKGQTIRIQAITDATGASYTSSGAENYFSIVKVGDR